MVSPLAGVIDATPVPITENVNPVPAITVLAAGNVIVVEPPPTRNTIHRRVGGLSTARRHQNHEALNLTSGNEVETVQQKPMMG